MRDFGIVALLSVVAIAAAPTAPPSSEEAYTTSKSTQQFADCYRRTHERDGSRLWYAADRRQAALSNVGAAIVRQPYFIEIRDRGTLREILLRGAASIGPEAQGVSQCV